MDKTAGVADGVAVTVALLVGIGVDGVPGSGGTSGVAVDAGVSSCGNSGGGGSTGLRVAVGEAVGCAPRHGTVKKRL